METVSKFTLNPLATCFIPSSMKYRSMTSAIFSAPSNNVFVSVSLQGTKTGLRRTTTNETNTNHLKITKAQPNSLQENFDFVTVKVAETTSRTVKEDEVVEEPLTKVPSTINEISEKETPVKSDDEETLESNSKHPKDTEAIDTEDIDAKDTEDIDAKDTEAIDAKDTEAIDAKDRDVIDTEAIDAKDTDVIDTEAIDTKVTDAKDTTLTKLDLSLPNKTISKIFILLKDGTKSLQMLLPFAVRSMLVMDFFYRIGLGMINLNVITTSHLSSVLNPKLKKITHPEKAKKTKTTKREAKNNDCHCPPMFGWIIPFQFFGNPLSLSLSCDKDYVHTSYDDGSLKQPQSESFESNTNEKITLEQCSLELKAVIKDVCDSISLHDEDNAVSKTEKRPVWETKPKNEIEKEYLAEDIMYDDGIHPLLQKTPEVDSEDAEISKIQALLEEAFSLHNSPREILPSQSVCNPPCSVWCNKVPPPAKDAYKRFIRNMDSESIVCNKVTDKVLKKPLYKRCFSADDTPKNYKEPFLSASSFGSKERLLLLHKDPVSFIKQSRTSFLRDTSYKPKSKHSVFSDQAAIKENSNKRLSDKWSFYDGADSMWQPLPDCIPSSDIAQKHSHRKAREVRRQKSVC